jgi:hypothetical protein
MAERIAQPGRNGDDHRYLFIHRARLQLGPDPPLTDLSHRSEAPMLRVVQWATGAVGRHAVAAMADHPDLEVMGALVYSDGKAGRDVGELCGIGPIGVTATKDRDEILALDADCVLYMAQGEMDPAGALDDICALLASGKNVISTAVTSLIYPASAGPQVVERLEKSCAEGRASFHATGIEPGWAAEVLPLTMSGLFRHIDSLLVQELLEYSSYDGWKVTIEGRPSMVLESKIAANGEDENDQGCLGTAMHAVHAIVPVCAAPPGIRTFLDLPTIVGRHVLRAATTRA